MKIISYNVNGIRAALKKGFGQWLEEESPDVICLQETKALKEQVDTALFDHLGYHHHWHSAEKKGYSGVAILSKEAPDRIVAGCGIDYIDTEGRVLRADFGDVSVFSLYFPSGSAGDIRQEVKMRFLVDFHEWIKNIRTERPNLVLSGDYNICHQAIDIHDPVRNAAVSGFLPEERQWVTEFLADGFIDSFRERVKEPHHYSWWSYRANARANNKGWRIDYNMLSEPLAPRLKHSAILPEVKHSDHCPILVELA
jgi:exodeoxyribonuclease-3